MHNKRFLALRVVVFIPLFLSACAGATTIPTTTGVPEVTTEVTAVATDIAVATETTETSATAEATGTTVEIETPASGTSEAMTATSGVEGTAVATGTLAITGTAEAIGTAELTGTPVMTGTTGATGMDIVDTAMASTAFSTLVRALNAAGLVETLKGQGPFTVFIPSDEAFAKLPADTLSGLLSDQQRLTNLLSYHVVQGRLTASDLTDGATLTTLSGEELRVRVENGVVYINDARVEQSDIQASNGVIHVIDTVLQPPPA